MRSLALSKTPMIDSAELAKLGESVVGPNRRLSNPPVHCDRFKSQESATKCDRRTVAWGKPIFAPAKSEQPQVAVSIRSALTLILTLSVVAWTV